ncbi:alkaline phosphatase D family protein [Actinocorallia longicatena]|uniref:Alkaline phosphatase D family protein n=1 Tax=Actinocorallia longicatena TaxID=111803 RepID=A0ABP6QGG3_9ACTN
MAIDRRGFLRTGLIAGGAAGLALKGGAPAFGLDRPALTSGVQTGDVADGQAIVWARADRPAHLYVDYGTRPDLLDARTVRGPLLTPDSDLTGKVRLRGLADGEEIHYRVRLDDGRAVSVPELGSFRTPPKAGQDVRFVWGGDLAGQGWGINESFGGFKIFNAMGALNPDFFLCSGDIVYSDGPLSPTVALPDGSTWTNLMTAEKSKVAETLAEYRGQFRYNLLDGPLKAFNARVPMVYQWDDHEVRNNWYPGQIIDDARYTEKRVDVLVARARQAALEYTPVDPRTPTLHRKISHGPLVDVFVLDMRTHKNPNTTDRETTGPGLLGPEQTAWLKKELRRSKATWKIIANDLPLGLIVPDGAGQEGVAQGDGGLPLGREREFADVLRQASRDAVTGIVFLTADVHYTAAHYYDPAKASFREFTPFWEFVAGPLNAGTFGPNTLDATFGPELKFIRTGPRANASPAENAQFFGSVAVSAETRALTVQLIDLHGTVLYTQELAAP